MVSFQTPVSPNQRKMISQTEKSSKKRRWEEEEEVEEDLERHSKVFDIELQLEQKPLPLEWQRCLDIQSGKIHFYNIRTQKRTSKDPRQSSPDGSGTSSPKHMSLELELNLPYESFKTHSDDNWTQKEPVQRSIGSGLSLELAHQTEMVAAVCQQCHMLVMLCKSSPACPSCKFMHPPDQGPPTLFKRHRLLCCKD